MFGLTIPELRAYTPLLSGPSIFPNTKTQISRRRTLDGPGAADHLRPFVARKGASMPRTSAWHSIKQTVHHNNTKCTEGNNIERENRREGTGGKPLCNHCARLNAEGK